MGHTSAKILNGASIWEQTHPKTEGQPMDRKNTRKNPQKMQLYPVDPKNQRRKHVAKACRQRKKISLKGKVHGPFNYEGLQNSCLPSKVDNHDPPTLAIYGGSMIRSYNMHGG